MLRSEQPSPSDQSPNRHTLESIRSRVNERLWKRLETLKHTSEDSHQILTLAHRVWEYLGSHEDDAVEQLSMTEAEKDDFVLATVLADIGKSGPLCEEGDVACQASQAFVKFLYEITRDHQSPMLPGQKIADFLRLHVPQDASRYISDLDKDELIPGLTSQSTLRAFFDIHTQYTLDLLLSDARLFETDPNAVLAAAAHHWIQGPENIPKFNNQPIIDIQTGEYQISDFRAPFDRVGTWVMILDKYEANFTRAQNGHLTPQERHDKAIGWLGDFINDNQILVRLPWLKDLFYKAIQVLDQAAPYRALVQTFSPETS